MKKLIIVLVIGVVGVMIWNLAGRETSRGDAVERLRAAIDASNLPRGSRDELRALLDRRRMRPSEFDSEFG